MHATIELARKLIQRPSLSPDDCGCQDLIAERLYQCGFIVQDLTFSDTKNLWATHGTGSPVVVFAGHTDVVPIGDEQAWKFPPFSAHWENNILHGRGSADMKGNLSALVVAGENFVKSNPNHRGTLAFLITSDEEDSGKNGTQKVVEWLQQQGQNVDFCLVGEPSSEQLLGDSLKNGRRGSLIANLCVQGVQGHVAYPHLACNPIHQSLSFLQDLLNEVWDQGNEFFPPTSFQITNINAGTGASNVIPPKLTLQCNWRYSSEISAHEIKQRVEILLQKHQLKYELNWHLSGEPFLTPTGKLTQVCQLAIKEITGENCALSTSGGTSDGRFIAKLGCQVVELGCLNATIHKVNEQVSGQDLIALTAIYQRILQELLC